MTIDQMINKIIKDTITDEDHLGDNLKKYCIEYLDKMNKCNDCWNDLQEWLSGEEMYNYYGYDDSLTEQIVLDKMHELRVKYGIEENNNL